MKQKYFWMILWVLSAFCIGCVSESSAVSKPPVNTPAPAPSRVPDGLDTAIRETSDYLNGRLPHGNKLVFLNLQSDYPDLSEYIIDSLTEHTVNDRIFTVVDRTNLALIQREMDFQLSGEVSDESAQAIGRKLGAQIIVSGAISPLGNAYRLRVWAIAVETAEIVGQFNHDISNSRRIADLTSGRALAAPVVRAASTDKVYKIGDYGPAGGLIFYDKGVFSGGWRYLEAAPAETEFTAEWGAYEKGISGLGTAVGTGKRNTQIIIERLQQLGETNRAAQLCVNLYFDGYKDWFLPSMDELDLMYKNLKQKGLGGFYDLVASLSWYWSSSTSGNTLTMAQRFRDGAQIDVDLRPDTLRVRAVRAF